MTIDLDRLLLTLDRAHDGPICDTFKWDTQIIPQSIAANLDKHGLRGTCDPDNPVNYDDELADRYFQAAMDVAVEAGMLCVDSQRIIKFSREEIERALEAAPVQFGIGEGQQLVAVRHRDPEDETPPVWICPLSIAVTEDVFVPLLEGIARVAEVDCLEGPSLEGIWGRQLRAGSPYELLAGKRHADLTHEAARRAGREGIGLFATGTATTDYGFLGSYGIPGGYKPERDVVLHLSPAEIKTTYEILNRLCQVYNCGGKVYGGSATMIGGSAGGPEGASLCSIACALLLVTAYQASMATTMIYDMTYMGNCGRKALWAQSVAVQALSRNTEVCATSIVNQTAGPATKMLLYESAVGMMNLSVSGASACIGPRSAGGKYTNYITPLEVKFAGEVFKRTAGMSREQANDIANRLLSRYEDRLRSAPRGESVRDCYDLDALQPREHWLHIYETVKAEAIDAGIPLD